jgi:hypothetical protein
MKQEHWSTERYREEMAKPRKNKMGNQKIVIDGMLFPSIRQANHYQELKIMKRQGLIIDFLCEHNFPITDGYYGKDGKWVRPEVYRADFVVLRRKDFKTFEEFQAYQKENGKFNVFEIHEPKGHRTRAYINKRKLFEKRYPEYEFIEI